MMKKYEIFWDIWILPTKLCLQRVYTPFRAAQTMAPTCLDISVDHAAGVQVQNGTDDLAQH